MSGNLFSAAYDGMMLAAKEVALKNDVEFNGKRLHVDDFHGLDNMEDVYCGYLAEDEVCPACQKPAIIHISGICRKCEIEIFE